MKPLPRGSSPGLAKVRSAPLVARRMASLARLSPGRLAELFEVADVVSEGGMRTEGHRVVYYGSTSLLVIASSSPELADANADAFAWLLARDPHARLWALRVAAREARARAGADSGGELGTIRADLEVSNNARGVLVLVEVVARIFGARAPSDVSDGATATSLGR